MQEEINKMLRAKVELLEVQVKELQEKVNKSDEDVNPITKWGDNMPSSIISETTNLEIAGEDYWEIDENGERKEYFTWDEAMELEKKLDGWRLPTRHEWVMIVEEFGQDSEGKLDVNQIKSVLELEENGYLDGGSSVDVGSSGYYWSSVVYSSSYAYGLYFNVYGYLNPQYNGNRNNGNSVRLVRGRRSNEF